MLKPIVVDLNHADVVEDWTAVAAAGIVGVIHKASQGNHYKDPAYATRRTEATEAGLLWGAYHFCAPGDPVGQAKAFLAAAQPDDTTLLAADWEPDHGDYMSLADVKRFLAYIADATGRTPVLYSGCTVKEAEDGTADADLAAYPLWLCQYGPRAVLPPGWSGYMLWQYAADGEGPQPHTIPGMPGNVDLNVSNLSPDALRAAWAGHVPGSSSHAGEQAGNKPAAVAMKRWGVAKFVTGSSLVAGVANAAADDPGSAVATAATATQQASAALDQADAMAALLTRAMEWHGKIVAGLAAAWHSPVGVAGFTLAALGVALWLHGHFHHKHGAQ